jgi:SMC interacting uncharacterized protein involved in chromosome segregation
MYIEISDDVYNGFDDELKSKLKEYKPEDVTGIKDKANTLLSEKKALEADLAEIKAENKKLKLKPAEGKTDELQSQLDDAMAKLQQSQDEIEGLKTGIAKGKVNTEASKLAGQLTKDTAKAELLAEKFANRLKYEGDSLTVLSVDGKPTVSKPEELISEMKERFAFLVDGSQASGGGSNGNNGGAGNAKTMSRQDFDELSQVDRAKFVKDGGKVE